MRFYQSSDYQPYKALRQRGSSGRFYLVAREDVADARLKMGLPDAYKGSFRLGQANRFDRTQQAQRHARQRTLRGA